jgi:hypothetical protein
MRGPFPWRSLFIVVVAGIVLLAGLVCVGALVFGKKQTDSVVDAMRREGVQVTTVEDAPIKDSTTVTAHKVFTTATGKRGHILQLRQGYSSTPRASDVADEYLPGQRYLFSHKLIVVVVGPEWAAEHPERIRAALDRLD